MDDAPYVEIKALRTMRYAQEYYEVRLIFLPGSTYSSPDGHFVEIKNKTGKTLKARIVSQCIARFKTKEDAFCFVHHMHQSKNKQKKHFFPPISDIND